MQAVSPLYTQVFVPLPDGASDDAEPTRFRLTHDICDTGGRTPLHLAALNGHAECIRMLLEKGSWADAFDGADNAALHLAARCAPHLNTRLHCAITNLPCLQDAPSCLTTWLTGDDALPTAMNNNKYVCLQSGAAAGN